MTILSAIGKNLLSLQLCLGCHMALAATDEFLPAEPPPPDFSTNYYVDSRGCGFVRAGLDGVTHWVPRVTKDRKLVCNRAGTDLEDAAQSVIAAPDVASAKTPFQGIPLPASPSRTEKNANLNAKLGTKSGPVAGPENMPLDYATAWQTQTTKRTALANNEPCGPKALSAWSSFRSRFVQVATFSFRANADRTVARLKTMGMPTVIKQNKMNGKVYCAVLSGPFDQKTDLNAALKTAQKAGFKDAFARR
jgi:cell division septation protein DedD